MRTAWNKGLTKGNDLRVLGYSQKLIGKSPSQNIRDKISQKLKGRVMPIDVREKISKSNIGKKRSMECLLNRKKSKAVLEQLNNLHKLPRTEKQREASRKHLLEINKRKKTEKQIAWIKKLSKSQRRERCPSWKGGITPLSSMIRNCTEGREWIINVFRKDNFTCQKCFSKVSGTLEAHHRKPFYKILSEFLTTYSQFSPIEDKETLVRLSLSHHEFWDINNGETLCNICHREIPVILERKKK